MAITTTQVDALEDWSDARTLKAARQARIQLLLGNQSVSIGNRSYTRADLNALNNLIRELENIVDSDSVGSIGIVRFSRP